MLEFVFFALLLPSYPVGNLNDAPEIVKMAQSLEFSNPYECIKINQNFLDSLNTENQYNKSDSFIKRIYSLNVLSSCYITSKNFNKATEYLDVAKALQNHYGTKETQLLIDFNANRYNLATHQGNIYKLGFSSNYSDSNENYPEVFGLVTQYEIVKFIHNRDYTKAFQLLQNMLTSEVYSSYSNKRKIFLHTILYKLFTDFKDDELSLVHLNNIYNLTQVPTDTYLKSMVSDFLADQFIEDNDFKSAIHNIEVSLNTLEKIPEEQTNYIKGLLKLAKLYTATNQSDRSLMLLQKADLLISNNDKHKNNIELTYALAHQYLHFNKFARVIQILQNGNNQEFQIILDNNRTLEITKSLDYAEACLGLQKKYEAKSILETLSSMEEHMTYQQKLRYSILKTALLASEKKYKTAFEQIYRKFYEVLDHATSQDQIHINQLPDYKQFKRNYSSNINNRNYNNWLSDNNDLIPSQSMFFICLTMFMLLITIYLVLKHQHKIAKQNQIINRLREQLHFATVPNINSPSDFYSYLVTQGMKYIDNQENKNKHDNFYDEKEVFHIYIPSMTELSLKYGAEYRNQILRLFIDQLRTTFNKDNIFYFDDSSYIIVRPIKNETTIQDRIHLVISNIETILSSIKLNQTISVGCIEYPFLTKTPFKLKIQKILDISIIALVAAKQLTEKNQKSSWVKLIANNIDESEFATESLRTVTQRAILNDHIKVQTPDDSPKIDWDFLGKIE